MPSPPETGWLTAEEQEVWRALIFTHQFLDEALDRQLQRDAGIPHAHYAILVVLSEADDRAMRMRELASVLHYSQSRLTHAVASLERKGMVRREACGTDRRGQVARLTPEGLAALEAAAPLHVAEVRHRVFDRLSPAQQRQLRDIYAALLAGFDEPD